jgi:multiple sugar transport system substrate-binding protein
MTTIRALGWDHERCMRPMRACAARWHEMHPDVSIEWHARSLRSFGDTPLSQLASEYDLLVIDHPFCGSAERDGTLLDLEDILTAETLNSLAGCSVGPSHASYCYHGRQWGLAVDAACQVSAIRPDLAEAVPGSWEDVVSLAESTPGMVALPLTPPHAISSWLTLVANHGGEPFFDMAAGLRATQVLADLARLGPDEAFDWEPPDALARMTETDELGYIPLTYGYSSYATRRPRGCRFIDIPSAGRGPLGAVLGGAGLAVSATTERAAEAAAFAAWACGGEAQREIVARAGGQPGHVAVWDDTELDALVGGFYSDTRATIDHAWMRPRDAWWPDVQLKAGELLARGLQRGLPPRAITQQLHDLYERRAR